MDFTKFLEDNLICIFSYNGPAPATLKFNDLYEQNWRFVDKAREIFVCLYYALDKVLWAGESEEAILQELYDACETCWDKLNRGQSSYDKLSLKSVLALLDIMDEAWEHERKAFKNFYQWYLETKYKTSFKYRDYDPGFPNKLEYFCPVTTSQAVIDTLEAEIFKVY